MSKVQSEMEREFLHEDVGNALELLYGDHAEEIAAELARHFQSAGIPEKAIHYLYQAGRRPSRLAANEEAIGVLTQGLALLKTLPATRERRRQELDLQLALGEAQRKAGQVSEAIEHEVQDGDELPIAGGIRAIHVPGHCAGQLAFLWPEHGGVLFAADAASNMLGLGYSLGYEDMEEGRRSLAKIAALDFETACFGHGKAVAQGALSRFRQKWATPAL